MDKVHMLNGCLANPSIYVTHIGYIYLTTRISFCLYMVESWLELNILVPTSLVSPTPTCIDQPNYKPPFQVRFFWPQFHCYACCSDLKWEKLLKYLFMHRRLCAIIKRKMTQGEVSFLHRQKNAHFWIRYHSHRG